MVRKARVRFWIESGLAVLTALLFVLTLISREWIEEIFGVEPDAGSGALEWGIVVALGVVCVSSTLLARGEWRRASAVS
jgi:hypothetical protein